MNLKEDYHVHTNYNDHSDSNLTVKNVVEEAERKGLEIIALTEHVRELSIWINALKKVIENKNVNVIGHLAPESSFYINTEEIEEFAKLLTKHDKIVEVNAKYKRPPENWVKIFIKRGVKFHLGSDAHSLSEIGNYKSIVKLIKLFA
jgi:histidinol phosphatase-like PHP family hydrolase